VPDISIEVVHASYGDKPYILAINYLCKKVLREGCFMFSSSYCYSFAAGIAFYDITRFCAIMRSVRE
jgi:hypothetical protein